MQRFNFMNALFRGLDGERTQRRNQSRRRRMPQVEGLESRVVLSTVPLTVFGTGLSTTDTLLPKVAATVDPHYTLVTPPSRYTPATNVVGPTYLVSSSATVLSDGAYVADGPNSEWISPDKSGNAGPNSPSGYYDYQTTFDLTGDNPNTAVLTGKWAVDNEGAILLNGKPVTSAGGSISTNTSASFHAMHSFTITATGSGVSFKPGTNTLDFIVHNDALETALRVDLNGTATPLSLPVFGTGVSTSGTLLNNTNNAPIDPHYKLVKPPIGYTPSAKVVGNAYALRSSDSLLRAPYVADGPTSEWISPDSTGNSAFESSGWYDYQTTFSVANPAQAVLTGDWAADNGGQILLNGHAVTSAGGTISTYTSASSFDTLHNFKIADSGSGVSFAATNTLDFLVYNDGQSPTALRVDLSGTD